MKELKRPIVILGAARSGTTLMVRTLRKHPDVACWNEPSFVWRYGHAFRKSDVIRRQEATPRIKAYIRGRFQEFLDESPGARFMEKTPGNCFRVGFVHEVLPDARFVHIIRDGRNVAISAADMWSGGNVKRHLRQRSEGGGSPPKRPKGVRLAWTWKVFRSKMRLSQRKITDWGSFLTFLQKAGRSGEHFWRYLRHDSTMPWGPQFPGFDEVRKPYSLLETTALQWSLSVGTARSAGLGLPEDQYLELRYEELLADPAGQMERILTFLELPFDDALLAHLIEGVGERRISSWEAMLTPEEVRDIEGVVGSTLDALGYPLTRTETEAHALAESY